jgi:3-oxoacyl-[acyl-carrier-protein] synthase II
MGRRRVVITGLGAITPIGNTTEEFWQSLTEGRNGAGLITKFDASNFDTKFAFELKNFNPLAYIDKKSIKRRDPYSQYALVTSEMAVKDAGLNLAEVNLERIGVVFGSGIGGMDTNQKQHFAYFQGGVNRISPFFVPMMISNIAAGNIAIKFGFKGPNYATTSACATGSHAIADACMLIERGMADVMVTGGSEAAITEMAIGGFNALKALSTNNDRYCEASRPFDKDRDGFVMGEGSGALILEEYEHAVRRGARIYADLAGLGLTDDAYHMTAPTPDGEGATRSMKNACIDGGIDVTQVDYINAHGTSTPYNDETETKAIKAAFGDHAYKLIISSTKSMTGHLLGAAGAIEAIVSVLALKNGIIPPTINLDEPDPACDLDYCPKVAQKREIMYALSNTFGFGGHNASLLFKKYVG